MFLLCWHEARCWIAFNMVMLCSLLCHKCSLAVEFTWIFHPEKGHEFVIINRPVQQKEMDDSIATNFPRKWNVVEEWRQSCRNKDWRGKNWIPSWKNSTEERLEAHFPPSELMARHPLTVTGPRLASK